MRIVGDDYIFKLMTPEFVTSLFDLRKRYFLGGEPSEIGKGRTGYFVAKFKKKNSEKKYEEYTLIGEGEISAGYLIAPGDKDYSFAIENAWPYVVEFENLTRYSKDNLLASEVFPDNISRKLNSQRPFGVDLSRAESKLVKERLIKLL